MNIFVLANSPIISAKSMCDKHVVKMILESAQLLSTAHRVLDGQIYTELSEKGRKLKRWKLPISNLDKKLYKATHVNHPSAKWVRECRPNYFWLYKHFQALLKEYTFRYGKVHKCQILSEVLGQFPKNLPLDNGKKFEFSRAISKELYSECQLVKDPIEAYRLYYRLKNAKQFEMKWTKRKRPEWMGITNIQAPSISSARTRSVRSGKQVSRG